MISQERRKVRVGQVVSDKMDKTVVVAVERRQRHRLYGKSIRRITRFKAHDEANQYHVGDTVRIVETSPLSKTKRWRVMEKMAVREAAQVVVSEAADIEVVALDEDIQKQREEAEATAAALAAEAEAEPEAPAAVEEEPSAAAAAVEEEPSAEAESPTEEAVAEAEEPPAAETPSVEAEEPDQTEDQKKR